MESEDLLLLQVQGMILIHQVNISVNNLSKLLYGFLAYAPKIEMHKFAQVYSQYNKMVIGKYVIDVAKIHRLLNMDARHNHGGVSKWLQYPSTLLYGQLDSSLGFHKQHAGIHQQLHHMVKTVMNYLNGRICTFPYPPRKIVPSKAK